MKYVVPNLAQLRGERDRALVRAKLTVADAKERASLKDADLAGFARRHPLAALGGALAVGAAAGLLLSARPVRRLAKSAGLAVFGPLVGRLSEELLGMAQRENGGESEGGE